VPLTWHWLQGDPARPTTIRVTVAGQPAQHHDLRHDKTFRVHGMRGDSVIEIRDHSVRFVESACPAKHCVLSGWHSNGGDSAACLPNRVAFTLLSDEDAYDGINF
jgi:hypothetical protein